MIKIASVLLLSFIGTSSVQSLFLHPIKEQEMGKDEKIVIPIINQTVKVLEKRHDIHFCGMGMGGMEELSSLTLSFQVKRILSKNEARKMILNCIEEILKNINSNEEIKPYLTNFPFSYENISISLYLKTKKGEPIYHPNISIAASNSLGLEFNTIAEENEYSFKERAKETYEEALQLVHRNE